MLKTAIAETVNIHLFQRKSAFLSNVSCFLIKQIFVIHKRFTYQYIVTNVATSPSAHLLYYLKSEFCIISDLESEFHTAYDLLLEFHTTSENTQVMYNALQMISNTITPKKLKSIGQ